MSYPSKIGKSVKAQNLWSWVSSKDKLGLCRAPNVAYIGTVFISFINLGNQFPDPNQVQLWEEEVEMVKKLKVLI